jgi:ferric-dicitrate binding protein FerR (iron transport regulator)
MTLPLLSLIGPLRQLATRLTAMRHRLTVSVAIRVVIVGTAVLCASGSHTHVEASCNALLSESEHLDRLPEGITIVPDSHVSVRRSANMLLVHVLQGEVLVKRRELGDHPIVVTAGTAQVSDIHAVVCVRVHKERTDVSVLEGAAELSELAREGDQHALGGITLRAGDRVELKTVGQEVQLRLKPTSRSPDCTRSMRDS